MAAPTQKQLDFIQSLSQENRHLKTLFDIEVKTKDEARKVITAMTKAPSESQLDYFYSLCETLEINKSPPLSRRRISSVLAYLKARVRRRKSN